MTHYLVCECGAETEREDDNSRCCPICLTVYERRTGGRFTTYQERENPDLYAALVEGRDN